MAVLDTSFLVALHDPDDRFHREAAAKETIGRRLLVPWEIWIETCQVLERLIPPPSLAEVLDDILRHVEIRRLLDEQEVRDLAVGLRGVNQELMTRGLKPLTLLDGILLLVAARLKEEVYSFDVSMAEATKHRHFRGARVG